MVQPHGGFIVYAPEGSAVAAAAADYAGRQRGDDGPNGDEVRPRGRDSVCIGAGTQSTDSVSSSSSGPLRFWLNGDLVEIAEPDPTMLLNDWIRRSAKLTGTKHSCGEAGCGACTVLLTYNAPLSGSTSNNNHSNFDDALAIDPKTIPVNSCLRLLCSVHGMRVTTIEGTSGQRHGFSEVQKRLAAYNGTQCGFCSSGMVMQMEGLLAQCAEQQRQPTEIEIEERFDGNLCRCTGYRSILAAFKTMAADYLGPHSANRTQQEQRDLLMALLADAQLKANDQSEFTDIEEICAARAGISVDDASSSLARLNTCSAKVGNRKFKDSGASCHAQRGHSTRACASTSEPCGSSSALNVNVSGALERMQGTHSASANVATWFSPTSMSDLYALLAGLPFADTKIVVGNTSAGIYKSEKSQNLISLLAIADGPLNSLSMTPTGITVGSAVSINDLRSFMLQAIKTRNGGAWTTSQVEPFQVLCDHIARVANTPVRSSACWAGNLAMCRKYGFLSDLAVIFMAAGATVSLGSSSQKYADITIGDFLKMDLAHTVIETLTIRISPSPSQKFRTYKAMLRHVNSHALVNSGFRCVVEPSTGKISSAVCVFGGIGQLPSRFPKTENILNGGVSCWGAEGKALLASCLETLESDVAAAMWPGWNVDNRGAYRAQVALNLFYKFFLSLQPASGPNALPASLQAALAPWPERPLSKGTQAWETDPSEYPLSEPVEKLSAITQVSGEARYADDVPAEDNELFVSFVVSSEADARLVSVDFSDALAAAGVVDVLTSQSITSQQNTWGPVIPDETLFATDKVLYYGQIIAAVCAHSQTQADAATKLVKVTYADINPRPILTNEQAIKAKAFYTVPGQCPPPPVNSGNIDKGFADAVKIIDGEWRQDANQYHFYMETQSGRVQPFDHSGGDTTADIGLSSYGVRCTGSMQDPSGLQVLVAQTLGIPQHMVEVETTRSGGGFGGKGSRNLPLHMITAIAASKHGVPARFRLNLNTNMQICGKRNQFLATYKVGLDAQGRMTALRVFITMNQGAAYDGSGGSLMAAMFAMDNCYYCPNTRFSAELTRTNLPPNTSTRGPGWVVGTAVMEHIIEHVGTATGLGADRARMLNFYKSGQVTPYDAPLPRFLIPEMWQALRVSADFDQRVAAVAAWNKDNRWVKRGIVCMPIKFGAFWSGASGSALLQVFRDGTIAVSHGGCEIGQGIHTKVAQAVAYRLNVPLDLVRVRGTSTEKTPNTAGTGGSITSAMNVGAALDACDKLLTKLQGVTGASWQARVANAYAATIDLGTKGWFKPPAPAQGPQNYQAYSVGIHEVLVDVLTGWVQIERVDILQDVGTSMNVLIDVGQVEGAFVMGLGLHLTEENIYDSSGHLVTDGTWEYKPPSALDIPVQFNVTLLKNTPNPTGIVHSKVVGEPPLCQAAGVLYAVQQAVAAARADINKPPTYFPFDAPATVARTALAASTTRTDLVI